MPKIYDLEATLPEHLLRVDPKTKELIQVPSKTLKGKTVLLYFSAHWCFPCQSFTPVLAEVYTALKKKDVDFEVVFVSSDNHSGQFELYFKYMADEGGSWLALPFKECREERAALASDLKVLSIPAVVVIGPDGTVVASNAKNAISKDTKGENFPWTGASVTFNFPLLVTLAFFFLMIVVNKYINEHGIPFINPSS